MPYALGQRRVAASHPAALALVRAEDEVVGIEAEDGLAVSRIGLFVADVGAIHRDAPVASACTADLDAEPGLEIFRPLGVDCVLHHDQHERNERDRRVVRKRLVAPEAGLDVPRVDRVVDQLEAREEARRQRAHEFVRDDLARPLFVVERVEDLEHLVRGGLQAGDRFVLAERSEARGTFVELGGHDGQAERRGRLLAGAGHREALQVALGDVDDVPAQVAHLPVAAGCWPLPRGLVEQLVELGALLSVQVEQELLARILHDVDAGRSCRHLELLCPPEMRNSLLSVHPPERPAVSSCGVESGSFTYANPRRIHWGPGALVTHLEPELDRLGARRAFVVTTRSVAANPALFGAVQRRLGPRLVGAFAEIGQHAPAASVAAAVAAAAAARADALISFGGGSPIDAAKAVAFALATGLDLTDSGAAIRAREFDPKSDTLLPHLAIPTTLSAAELSGLAGFTTSDEHEKVGLRSAALIPASVVYDAQLSLPTPLELWLSTGIRAVDHAVETVLAPGSHPLSDTLALDALRRLHSSLLATKRDPTD